MLAHQLWWGGFTLLHPHGAVVLAALWLLARPSSKPRLAVLFATEAVSVALDLPAVGDHTLLALVVCLVGLATRCSWDALAPFLRAAVVLLYGAAAFSKLNAGFLDAGISCVGPQVRQIADAGWLVGAAVPATIAIELLLALLLAVPRTRLAGILLGCAFHAVLALTGNVPFAALMLALYIAFLPADPASAAAERSSMPGRRAGAVGLGAALYLVGAWAQHQDPALTRDVTRQALEVATVAGALAFSVLAVQRRQQDRQRPERPRGRHRAITAVALALLTLNAASPYLGLKTEATFTMFSNLQTEPGHWNHHVVPEAVRVFGLQDDLVRIPRTTVPALERRRRAGILMVRREYERLRRGGEPDGPADRVLNFYDVRPGARGRC